MSVDSVRETVFVFFIPQFSAAMTAALGSVPKIVAPNYREPDTGPFIKFTFMESDSHNAALDGKLRRHTGFMQVDVYVDIDTGSKVSNIICDAVSSLMTNKEFTIAQNEYLTFNVGKTQEVGSERGLYRQMVRIPFNRDEQG